MDGGLIVSGGLFLVVLLLWLWDLCGDLQDHRRKRDEVIARRTRQVPHQQSRQTAARPITVRSDEIEAQRRKHQVQRQMIEYARHYRENRGRS